MTTVPPYQVTVTAVKRRGRGRKTIELKTFEYDKANRMWVYEPRKLKEKFYDGANADDFISAMLSKNHGRLVSGGTVWPIGTAKVPVVAANVIFNAIRNAGRVTVDIDDIKLVLSQLGSEIVKLRKLPGDQRQHAEAALYSAIIERCSTL